MSEYSCETQGVPPRHPITSDGNTVMCLTLTDVDADEMVAIWVACDAYRARPGLILSATSPGKVIEPELGVIAECEK